MRIVKYGGGRFEWIPVERCICSNCHYVRRILPDTLLPYKHYSREIIEGFVKGLLDGELIFEDYPCDMTIVRWRRSQNLQAS